MSSPGSVSIWLARLKDGDSAAAQHLWESYFRRLVGLARQKLQGRPRAVADEEDVALSAFHSFCAGAERGSFPKLLDRDDLWQVLVMITARKSYRLLRDQGRQKRGGGAVQHVSALEEDLAAIIGTEPTPDFAAQVAEEYGRLLELLGDEELKAVARDKLEGYSNAEIADRLGVVERTVERRLGVIRKLWDAAGEGA
jgi:DNA-directed RNA polymerase specialized sigma24 family protein